MKKFLIEKIQKEINQGNAKLLQMEMKGDYNSDNYWYLAQEVVYRYNVILEIEKSNLPEEID